MTGAIALLAVLCLFAGLLPFGITPLVDLAVASAAAPARLATLNALAPMRAFAAVALGTTTLVVLVHALLRLCVAPGRIARAGTWDCGHADPSSPRLQYTASSFAQFLLRLLAWAVPRRTDAPPPMELFPPPARFHQTMRETLLHGVLLPFCQRWADRCSRFRILQQGNVHLYLLYILAVLLLLLGWSVVDAWLRT
jgi:hydrogenase-4 component B